MARRWPIQWRRVPWSESEVLTRGTWCGLPVFSWRWAPPELATRRQLRALGLRPGGQAPVAVLMFRHRKPGCRRVELADLFLISEARPVRPMTPARWAAVGLALAARRTCRACGVEQDYFVSTISRLCEPCAERTGFWPRWATERGGDWGQAA
jgi:hypothetical protein